MENLSLLFYSIVIVTALISAGYNFIYKKETHRIEQQLGIVISHSLYQLLSIAIYLSLFIAAAALLLFFVSFLSR